MVELVGRGVAASGATTRRGVLPDDRRIGKRANLGHLLRIAR